MTGIIGANNKATATNGGAQGGAPARHKKTGRIKMTPDMLSRIDAGGPVNRMGIAFPVTNQADHLPRLQAAEDEIADIEADIAKLKTDIDDDHSDIRAEVQQGDDDLQGQIDALKLSSADDASDLQDKISAITTGLLHEEPVDSICVDPPTKPREDAYYLVSAVPPPTGAFVGHDNQIATWNKTTKWTFTAPEDQETRLVEAENKVYTWNGTKWVSVGSVAKVIKTHDLTDKPALAGGDEFAIVDVGDAWAAKKVSVANLRADISKYAADDAQNLKNKGFNLSDNTVRGTIDEFNAALTDGYEFATKDDIADFISRDDAQAYADNGDTQTLADVAENLGLGLESLHTLLTQEIEDAIDAIPDAPAPDFTEVLAEAQRFDQEVRDDLDDAIDVQKKYIDDQDTKALRAMQVRYSKLSDALAAGDDSLDVRIKALTDDLNTNYSNSAETTAQIDAVSDYMIALLARHASSGDSAIIASIKSQIDDIFNKPVSTPGVKDATAPKGGHRLKPPPPKPKPWVAHLEDKEYVHLGPGAWVDVPALPANPVKGSLFFNACLDVAGNHVILKTFIHNGTDWVDDKGQTFPNNVGPGDRPSTPTMQKYSNNPGDLGGAHSETQYFNPSSVIAVACADGIHMCYCDEMQNPPGEYVVPYPAGVTLADMPASKTF